MASVVYNAELRRIMNARYAGGAAAADLRALLIIGTTTTPFDKDHAVVNDIIADEADDASYARVAVAGFALTTDNTNDRIQATFDPIVFAGLDGPNIVGVIIYEHLGADDALNQLVFAFDVVAVPDAVSTTFTPASTGAVHVRQV